MKLYLFLAYPESFLFLLLVPFNCRKVLLCRYSYNRLDPTGKLSFVSFTPGNYYLSAFNASRSFNDDLIVHFYIKSVRIEIVYLSY